MHSTSGPYVATHVAAFENPVLKFTIYKAEFVEIFIL